MQLTSFKYKTRKGPDYRHGEQVSFIDIKETFGIGGIRIGKWVNTEEKDLAANLIFDSLADLAYLLALPPSAIGLRMQVLVHLLMSSGMRSTITSQKKRLILVIDQVHNVRRYLPVIAGCITQSISLTH